MAEDFVAETAVTIDAPAQKVWDGLTQPELVKQYLHGTSVSSDWKKGSPITWKGEWEGKSYEDKGEILEIEPGKRLTTTHWSPLGGDEDRPENYHTVTYELSEQGGKTRLVLKQANNPSREAADKMAENWASILGGLKSTVEK